MRSKQLHPRNQDHARKYKCNYSPSVMTSAYKAVKEGNISVNRAANLFRVPYQTLRDRVTGKISIDIVKAGRAPLFSLDEEEQLVKHIKLLAKIGYGYSIPEVLNLATDFAIKLNKRQVGSHLNKSWFYKFISRWPELKVIRAQSLEFNCAKSVTPQVINAYFVALKEILTKYDLLDHPQNIYNIDEKGITIDHKPPHIVSQRNLKSQAVTCGKSNTITIIGSGNALGNHIPPYFIFPGKRMNPDLMDGATAGAVGVVSESGWSNAKIFDNYLKEHFFKFATRGNSEHPLLIVYDGHTSHVSVEIIEWARQQNIILFVLPPHSSHLLQPLDIACFGPFQQKYNLEVHSFMRNHAGRKITRYDVCKIACHVYGQSLCPTNLQSSFKKSGIHPFNEDVVAAYLIAPSQPAEEIANQLSCDNYLMSKEKELVQRTLEAAEARKERRSVSKIIGGKAITEDIVLDQIKEYNEKQKNHKKNEDIEAKAGPSGHCTKGIGRKGKKIPKHDEEEDEDSDNDDDKCCVCHRQSPPQLREISGLIIVKWAQCDVCNHWTHLRFCSKVRVVRRHGSFLCPCCQTEE